MSLTRMPAANKKPLNFHFTILFSILNLLRHQLKDYRRFGQCNYDYVYIKDAKIITPKIVKPR